MKQIFILVAMLLLAGCAALPNMPGVLVLEAQQLPITKSVAWDAVPNATGYRVTLDGAVVGDTSGLEMPFKIETLGAHTLTVQALNLWTPGDPETLTINVTKPGKPTNLRIK